MAEAALDELAKHGVTAALDEAGRARFTHAISKVSTGQQRQHCSSPTKVSSRDARRVIEVQGDLIEAFLLERARQARQARDREGSLLSESHKLGPSTASTHNFTRFSTRSHLRIPLPLPFC